MKIWIVFIIVLLTINFTSAYTIKATRYDILKYYYSNIDDKIPKYVRMLIGNERINVYIGDSVIGADVRGGYLLSFNLYPIDNPTIAIRVSDFAIEMISKRQMGIMSAIKNKEIVIETKDFITSLKIEALKRIYAVSGIDEKLMNNEKFPEILVYNTLYVQRARFSN